MRDAPEGRRPGKLRIPRDRRYPRERVLKQLQLEKFRGFAGFTAEIGQVTAAIGRNSSGKTTLLQAIRVACDGARLALTADGVIPRVSTGDEIDLGQVVIPDPTGLVGLVDWTQLITDGETGDGVASGISLKFERGPVQQLAVQLIYGRNAQLKLAVQVVSQRAAMAVDGLAAKSPQRPVRLRDELERWLPRAVFVPPFHGVVRSEEYRTRPHVERALAAGDQTRIVRNLLARLDRSQVNSLNQLLARSIGEGAEVTDWTSERDLDRVTDLLVRYRDSNGKLELSTAGAGLVSTIALAAALEWTRPVALDGEAPTRLFLFDEPEAHLHPRLQGEIGQQLADAVTSYGAQLVLATHSVEMVNRLGRRSGTVLLHVDRSRDRAVPLTSDDDVIAALDEFCDLTPYSSINLLASRRVVFHEGPSDWKILDACAEIYFRNDPTKLAAWRRYVPVPLEGVGNATMKGVLEKLVSTRLFKLDRDRVRLVLVRDRDATRSPRPPALVVVPDGQETIDVVWSRNSIESLFLVGPVYPLRYWLKAYLGQAVSGGAQLDADLDAILAAAHAAADADPDLMLDAYRLRVAALTSLDVPIEGTRREAQREADAQARAEVRDDPATWQKGRDRARVVLGHVRRSLPPAIGGQLSVDLSSLIASCRHAPAANPAGIPIEIIQLLDAMVV